MIQRDKWYTIGESVGFPSKGEVSISLGPSSLMVYASVDYSSALISLINYSIVPGVSIDVRIQKRENRHQIDIKFTTIRTEGSYEETILFMSGSSWNLVPIIESVEYNSVCQLLNIKDAGGAVNPWIYMYLDSSNGYMLAPGESTKIIAKILHGWYDITDKMIGWQWSRESGDYADDLAWNIAHSALTTEAEISYEDLGAAVNSNTSCTFIINSVYEQAAITSMFRI